MQQTCHCDGTANMNFPDTLHLIKANENSHYMCSDVSLTYGNAQISYSCNLPCMWIFPEDFLIFFFNFMFLMEIQKKWLICPVYGLFYLLTIFCIHVNPTFFSSPLFTVTFFNHQQIWIIISFEKKLHVLYCSEKHRALWSVIKS